jgi:hypothetical protein
LGIHLFVIDTSADLLLPHSASKVYQLAPTGKQGERRCSFAVQHTAQLNCHFGVM